MLVAILCAVFTGSAWATDYSETYNYSALSGMLSGNYDDASSYWKVPGTAGNTATIAIPITYQPTSNITITFNIATFGSGNNPSSSNTTITAVGTETGSNWSGSDVSQYPSDKNYKNCVMTITKPGSPTTLGGLTITMGVNSGVKIFRLQSITVEYTYTASSDPSSDVSFENATPSLDLKDKATYKQAATTAVGYAETDGASVTYEMTANTAGATIDASSGTVTPTKAGSVTVKATAAAIVGAFAASYATYTLTVTDNREWDVTCHIGNNTSVETRKTGATLSLDNPSAICGMSFVGWSSTDNVASPTWVSNTTKVSGDMTLYAIYEYVPGEYSYHLVESSQADWRGDYLIAYSSSVFANGQDSGTAGIGSASTVVDPDTKLSGKVVDGAWGDDYYVTLEAIDDTDLSKGYILKTQGGYYNYHTNNTGNGINGTSKTKATASAYPITIDYVNSGEINITLDKGQVFRYNTSEGYFRYYKSSSYSSMGKVYLYKRTEDVAPVYSLGLTESVTLNTSGYATFASTSPLDFSDDSEYSAWQITAANSGTGVLTFSQITGTVAAGTGVLLKGTASASVNILIVASGTDISATNKLTGITTATDVTAGQYYGLKANAFVPVNAGTVPAGKALLPASEVAGVKAFTFVFEDATAIAKVQDSGFKIQDSEIFNLAGQRMSKLQKGVNIVNGKKVLVK